MPDAALGIASEPGCPQCGQSGATLTLLTSMTRYYRCPRCERSWNVMDPGTQPMVPGRRERGALTRFAAGHAAVAATYDVSLDAALRADRQREGGGGPSERRPAVRSRWRAMLDRMMGRGATGSEPAAALPSGVPAGRPGSAVARG